MIVELGCFDNKDGKPTTVVVGRENRCVFNFCLTKYSWNQLQVNIHSNTVHDFPQSGTKGNFWANPKVTSSKMNIKYSYKCTHPFISFPYDILYDSQRKKVHSLKRSLKRKLPFTTASPTSTVIIDTGGSGSGLGFDETADISLATGVAHAGGDNVAQNADETLLVPKQQDCAFQSKLNRKPPPNYSTTTEPVVHRSLVFDGAGPQNLSVSPYSKRHRRKPNFLHKEQSSAVLKDKKKTKIVSQKQCQSERTCILFFNQLHLSYMRLLIESITDDPELKKTIHFEEIADTSYYMKYYDTHMPVSVFNTTAETISLKTRGLLVANGDYNVGVAEENTTNTAETLLENRAPVTALVVSPTTELTLIKPLERSFIFPVPDLCTHSLDLQNLYPALWHQCLLSTFGTEELITMAGNPSTSSCSLVGDDRYLTGQDLECIKPDGWYKPIHISFYFSWILSSFGNHKQPLQDIMVLPHEIYSDFVKSFPAPSTTSTKLYDELVQIEKRDIFDTSLSFLLIYQEPHWSLLVLMNLNRVGREENQISPLPCVMYFASPKSCSSSNDLVRQHINTFIQTCWQKKQEATGSIINNSTPSEFPILFCVPTGK